MNKNLTEIKKNIIEIAYQAGETIKKSFSDDNIQHYQKDGVDFTTQVDKEVDSFLKEKIASLYPQSNFLTEETAPSNYKSMEELEDLWIIDPLDGTINFSRKNTNFAISIALVNKGIPILGIVYLPMCDMMYSAQSDEDNALLNGKAINVSSISSNREIVLGCDWSWDLQKRSIVVKWLNNIYSSVRQIKSMGSAASDLASLAAGKIDAYVHSGIKPWDIAAAALIIEKAGGRITTPEGNDWNVFNADIAASNGIIHNEIIRLINNK